MSKAVIIIEEILVLPEFFSQYLFLVCLFETKEKITQNQDSVPRLNVQKAIKEKNS